MPVTDELANVPIAMFSGEQPPADDADAMRARIAAGQTVLVCNLTAAAREYWQQVIGASIDIMTPERTVWQLVRGEDSPLLGGISNEDTCWLTNWTYCQDGIKEEIAGTLLRVDGGTNLLCNATRSGVDVLYGDEQATEWRRMPVLSRYFDNPKPEVDGGLVEAPVGHGRVLFWQINWRPDQWRFHRVLGLLLMNLGAPTGSDVLDGDAVTATGKAGDGFPVTLRAARMTDEEMLREIIELAHRHTESYSGNLAYKEWPHWQWIDTPNGALAAADVPGDGPIIIGMEVCSPAPRKIMETIGGLPNPDLQTFLRLRGAGRVRAWLDTRPWGEAHVAPGETGYIPDIDFDAGSNFMILLWEPAGEDATLSLLFENKDRRPEMTFIFW